MRKDNIDWHFYIKVERVMVWISTILKRRDPFRRVSIIWYWKFRLMSTKDYDDYNRDYALNILERHLENRGDDGRPSDVEIGYDVENHIVRIYAKVNYLGNDHTIYKFR